MIHAFDPQVAEDVGIESAILYKNISYWCEKNRLNGVNEHDGLFWTYNSIRAFLAMFPYMSKDIISRNLKKLEDKGYIKKGNYNKVGFDRTLWYADLKASPINATSISQKSAMDSAEMQNAIVENAEPIPNINTNKNTNNNKQVSKASFDAILDSEPVIAQNPDLKNAFIEFIKMRKLLKCPLTDRALRLSVNQAKKLGKDDPRLMVAVLEQSIQRGWKGLFPLHEEATVGQAQEEDFLAKMLMEVKQNESGDNYYGADGMQNTLSLLLPRQDE